MFSYNNKMHLTQSSAILQQKKQLFSSYDLSAMGSELTSIISSQENTFKPALYDSNGSYYQMGLNTDFFNGEQIWQPLTVNSNSFASFSQTESFSRAASSPKEPFRAIIKKSNNSVHKNETNPAIPMCPRPKESEDKPKLVDDKPKFVKKVVKAPSCLRQLPIRSQNIDMSQFLKKADSFSSIGSSSCVSPSSSSMSDSFSTASPPLCSPTRAFNKSVKNMQVKCSFCENNGESEEIYMSHPLKDSLSRVVCPILRNFECPKCHEKGDYAHTNKYCPETQRKRKENKIKSILSTSD